MKIDLWGAKVEFPAFNIPVFLVVTTTLGFFGLIGKVALYEVPTGSKEIAFAMIGSISAAWTGVVGYYFGSSSGSAAKTALLAPPTTSTTTTTPSAEVRTVTEPQKAEPKKETE